MNFSSLDWSGTKILETLRFVFVCDGYLFESNYKSNMRWTIENTQVLSFLPFILKLIHFFFSLCSATFNTDVCEHENFQLEIVCNKFTSCESHEKLNTHKSAWHQHYFCRFPMWNTNFPISWDWNQKYIYMYTVQYIQEYLWIGWNTIAQNGVKSMIIMRNIWMIASGNQIIIE